MKTYLTIISVCVLVVGSIGLFITARSGAQEQNQQAYDVACEAFDSPSLKDCVQKAKNKEADLIKITKMIECINNECAIELANFDHAVKIYGISNTDTGFKRSQTGDYSLITVRNVKNLVIGSFLIEDNLSQCTNCPSAISIENSTNITVDQLRTKSIVTSALAITTSSSITVKNSTFVDSNASALRISVNGGTNLINNNTFTHNHHTASFANCGGICVAAQVTVLPQTKNLTFSRNRIQDGSIDLYGPLGLYASGIDIAGADVENVVLSCNKISNNQGNGIVIPQQTSTKNITIEKNAVFGNGIDINVISLPQNTISNNCSSSNCSIPGC